MQPTHGCCIISHCQDAVLFLDGSLNDVDPYLYHLGDELKEVDMGTALKVFGDVQCPASSGFQVECA